MVKLAALLGLVFILFDACQIEQATLQPVQEMITESVYASGIIKSKSQYQVYSSVNGLIEEVLIGEGDLVKKGDPIIRLTNKTAVFNRELAKIAADYSTVNDNTEKLDQLTINIDLTETKMQQDAALLARQRNLWSQQIGTHNDLEQRELAYKNSVNNYEAAKLRYVELKKQIVFQEKQSKKSLQLSSSIAGDFNIKSETAGRVYNIFKKKGEMVTTQSPVALIGATNIFMIELQVDEYDITRLKLGQKIVVSMDSYKDTIFEAIVDKIIPMMNERTKSFTVEAVFVKQPPALYPNLTCEANIVIQQKDKALLIPRNYLLPGDYVLIQGNEKRKVTTGLKDYQKVEITSGLTVTDVLLKPVNEL
jgi:multidrug efflux pump subunit AcrA (membrane-fusion protein)